MPANEITLSGNIETHESLVSFKVQGRVIELPVEEGQQVEQGTVLARLEDADLKQKVRMDEADVQVRASDLALTLAGTREQEVKASQQAVMDAKADLDEKKVDNDRAQRLFAKDEISAQDRDLAATALKRAEATFRASQQRYNEAVEGSRKEDIAIARANLAAANAGLGLSRIDAGYTTLRAPTTGVITVRQAVSYTHLDVYKRQPLELAEPLRYRVLAQSKPEDLLAGALETRADYLSLASQRQSLMEQQRANRARWYPKLSINGNVGELGRSIGGVDTTGLIQGQADFTIFDRDRDGEAQQLLSRMKRIDDQIADLRRGVDEDIREALLNLDSTAQQVKVASDGQELARRELELAQDRFQAGTANNVEVVTAQDELARAEENYILAVSSHVDAKYALARALGDTETVSYTHLSPAREG